MYKLAIKSIQFIIIGAIGVLVSIMFTSEVSAQELALSPATGTISTQGSITINVIVTNPGSTNAGTVDLSVPSPLQVTNASVGSGLSPVGGCAAGGANFSSNQVCLTLFKTSSFSEGEVLASFTVTGTSTGSSTITYGPEAELSDGVDTFTSTGTAGTFTITSEVLPETSIELPLLGELDNYRLLVIGLILFDLAAVFIFLQSRNSKQENSTS